MSDASEFFFFNSNCSYFFVSSLDVTRFVARALLWVVQNVFPCKKNNKEKKYKNRVIG